MAERIRRHCERPMIHVARGLYECGACGVVETEPKKEQPSE